MKKITRKVDVLYGIEFSLNELMDKLCERGVEIDVSVVDGFSFIPDDDITAKIGNKSVKLSDIKIRVTGDSFKDLN